MSLISSINQSNQSWIRRTACLAVVAFMMMTGTSLYAAFCDTGANVGNLIANCGFENSAVGTTPVLWNTTFTGSATVRVSNIAPLAPNGDTRYALLTNPNVTSTSLFQSIGGLVSGGIYDLSFLYKGGSSESGVTLTDSASNLVINNIMFSPNWTSFQTQFTASTNSPYTISFATQVSPGSTTFQIDNVILKAVSVPVPEPASLILLGSLCSAVVGYKWKRKQSLIS